MATIATITGWLALAGISAYSDDSARSVQSRLLKITSQPQDLMVCLGSNAAFKVEAENARAYQWLHNGNPISGQTSNSLTIKNAGIDDVGYYSCDVYKDKESAPTRGASLTLYTSSTDPQTGADPIVVFGLPLLGSGSQGTCPGKFTGYVNYTKTNGWGWSPDTNNGNTTFTASDTNRTNTKVLYVGEYGDGGCHQTTVTVPNPPSSPVYAFSIYFTNNVPTNAYGITLTGFNP